MPVWWLTQPTNRHTDFCILFFAAFLIQSTAKWGAKREHGGEIRKALENSPYSGGLPAKISLIHKVNFRENKKATPTGTLSVPLKRSRLVWLYVLSGRYRCQTSPGPRMVGRRFCAVQAFCCFTKIALIMEKIH